jgi:hypothetical protein
LFRADNTQISALSFQRNNFFADSFGTILRRYAQRIAVRA